MHLVMALSALSCLLKFRLVTPSKTYSRLELSYHCELEGVMIRLHPLYMITGDPHAPLRATRAVYTPRGDTRAPDMRPR